MKSLNEIKHILQEQKPFLKARYGIVDIWVFGSFVRNEQNQDSDIDILIDFDGIPGIDLLDLVNLEEYLSDLIGIKANVAIKSSLRKRIGQRILSEAVPV